MPTFLAPHRPPLIDVADSTDDYAPDQQSIELVHHDADAGFVVINKPPGLLSVPGRGAESDPRKADCVIARVRRRFPNASGPMVVHRLDMETSGLMIVALNADAQRRLSKLFETRRVEKRYVALLSLRPGEPTASAREQLAALHQRTAGAIAAPLRLDPDRRPRQVFDPHQGKPAETRWRLLDDDPTAWFGDEALDPPDTDAPTPGVLVEFQPITGRSHQLRVHAALDQHRGGLGRPICGDSLYSQGVGEVSTFGSIALARRPVGDRLHSLALHACQLHF